MARRRSTKIVRHHSKKFTIPLAVVAGFVPMTMDLAGIAQSGTGWKSIGNEFTRLLTGYSPADGKWSFTAMKCGTLSIAGGFLVHWLVGSKLGVNKMLARTGIPLIRI